MCACVCDRHTQPFAEVEPRLSCIDERYEPISARLPFFLRNS